MDKRLENIELRSQQVKDILTIVPHWLFRYGNLISLIAIVILFITASIIKYPDVIVSDALITTEIPPIKKISPVTAQIETILIQDNRQVREKQPILILKSTASYKDVFLLKKMINNTTFEKSSFDFPVDSISHFSLGTIEDKYREFENAFLLYKINRQLQPIESDIKNNTLLLSERKIKLENLQSQLKITTNELALISKEVRRFEVLFQKGVIASDEFEKKKLKVLQNQKTLKNIQIAISQTKETITSSQTSLKKDGIAQKKETLILWKNVIQSFSALKRSIKQWEMKYVVRSDFNGVVSFFSIKNVNQYINKGDVLCTIVPSKNQGYTALLKTPAQNAGKIQKRQRVYLKIHEYPAAEFGVITGYVKNISLIADGQGIYHIEVGLPQPKYTSYNKRIDIKHQMSATAEIVTEELTLIHRFFYQLRKFTYKQ